MAQIQAGNTGVPVSKLRMLVGAKWRQLSRGAQGERLGPTAPDQRGGRPAPQGVNSGASLGLPAGGLHPPGPGNPDAKHQHHYQREEDRGTGSASRPGGSGREVRGEGHDPGSHTPCRPQTTQGQFLDCPEEPGREEETRKSEPTAGSQEEEEILGIHSPEGGLDKED